MPSPGQTLHSHSQTYPLRGSNSNGSLHIQLKGNPSESQSEVVEELIRELSISRTTAQLLVNRGMSTIALAKAFLSPTLREHLPDPSRMLNLDAAADEILNFVSQKQPITIYTDFDVDGLSAGSQLFVFLDQIGAIVSLYTPNRFTEGYGLSTSAVEKLARAGTKLLVTVDCGISSHEELARAKQLGLRTVVLDHHQPSGLPPADVVVDPAQDGCPFQEHKLCAAGIVWMLLIVLRAKLKNGAIPIDESAIPDPKDFLDLAALGTVCDMVPLVGANRVIAARGVEAIKKTKRIGLIALKQAAGLADHRLGAGHLSFVIGPRMNAAGRVSDAKEVFELLTTDSPERARELAQKIERCNADRKSIEERVLTGCLRMIEQKPEMLERKALTLFDESFHVGVIGIVAQRLVERFHRPAAVMAPGEIEENGNVIPVIKGSVRSISGFHVAECLHSLEIFLISGGGHAEAGGFTVTRPNLDAFQEAFRCSADVSLREKVLGKRLFVDLDIALSELNHNLVTELQRLGPFGVGNPSPLFSSSGVTIDGVTSLSNNHLRFRISDGANSASAIAWSMRGHPHIRKGEKVNIAYLPELNTYQGVSSVQLNVKEVWKPFPEIKNQ